ncbi:MAG: universal stress protein [Planctomycetota bacterium]
MIRRILVGLGDLPYTESATNMALDIARFHDAQLTGISVMDVARVSNIGPVPLGAGGAAVELQQHRLLQTKQTIKDVNQRFEVLCQDAHISYEIHSPEGNPYHCLADKARYHDLVICGLSRLFEHGVVDEPPDELVWLVQAGVRPLIAVTSDYREIHRALISYSGSMESAKAMKRFVQMRLWPDVRVRIVTFEHKHEKAQALLDEAAGYCRAHGLVVDTEHRPESPVHGLIPYAREWNPDLMVLGNSGRNLILRHVFGETMLYTVKHTDRPLFLAQ